MTDSASLAELRRILAELEEGIECAKDLMRRYAASAALGREDIRRGFTELDNPLCGQGLVDFSTEHELNIMSGWARATLMRDELRAMIEAES